ncbi:MAG: phytanoyl-CoA dioxygenase family protein [Pseudomonadota bacterium]
MMKGLSAGDRERFHEDGVVCLRGVLSEAEISGLRSAVDEQFAQLGTTPSGYDFEAISRQVWAQKRGVGVGEADRFDFDFVKTRILDDPDARPLLETSESGEGRFFYDVAGWRRYPAIYEAAAHSALPGLIASLWDTAYLNFWEDTTFIKSPGTRQKTAYHQDLAYFQIEGTMCAVCWIPLDPANLSNGVTKYVRGSHKWRRTFAPNLVIAQTSTSQATDEKLPDIESAEGDYDILSFDVMPGDVILHDVRTVHGAGGNVSDRPRRAISFRYCGDDIRYYDRPGAIPQIGLREKHQNGDRLCGPDYPIVWTDPAHGQREAS